MRYVAPVLAFCLIACGEERPLEIDVSDVFQGSSSFVVNARASLGFQASEELSSVTFSPNVELLELYECHDAPLCRLMELLPVEPGAGEMTLSFENGESRSFGFSVVAAETLQTELSGFADGRFEDLGLSGPRIAVTEGDPLVLHSILLAGDLALEYADNNVFRYSTSDPGTVGLKGTGDPEPSPEVEDAPLVILQPLAVGTATLTVEAANLVETHIIEVEARGG